VQELQRAGLDSRAVEAAVELSAVLAEALLEQAQRLSAKQIALSALTLVLLSWVVKVPRARLGTARPRAWGAAVPCSLRPPR
jgi:hypothetical protein